MGMLPPTKTALAMMRAASHVTARRLRQGPLRPGWSWSYETLVAFMKEETQRVSRLPPEEQRQQMEELPAPPSLVWKRVTREFMRAGVTGEWFIPRGASDVVTLYFHGGAYVFGSTKTQGEFIARLAEASGGRVLGLNYRLAPEEPYPAALEDARSAYRWLLATGHSPSRIVFAGSSSGGGLALAAMLSLRDLKEPLPAGAVLLSPWVDLTCAGQSQLTNGPFDWEDKPALLERAKLYVGAKDPTDPLISPTFADLKGLPPLFLQVGGAELFHDCVVAFAQKARAAGVPVTLDAWEDMVHSFQSFGAAFPESLEATERLGQAIRELAAGRR